MPSKVCFNIFRMKLMRKVKLALKKVGKKSVGIIIINAYESRGAKEKRKRT